MPRRRSPDGAPAAAQRRGGTTLTPTSGNPPSGGEEGPEPKTPNPAGAAQQTPYTPAPATVALSQEAVCCDHRQNPPTPLVLFQCNADVLAALTVRLLIVQPR